MISIDQSVLNAISACIVVIMIVIVFISILPKFSNSDRPVFNNILKSKNPLKHLLWTSVLAVITVALYFVVIKIYPAEENPAIGNYPVIILTTLLTFILMIMRSLFISEQSYTFGKKLQLAELIKEIQIFIFDLDTNNVDQSKQSLRTIIIKYNFDELGLSITYKRLVECYKADTFDKNTLLPVLDNFLGNSYLKNQPALKRCDFDLKEDKK